MSARPRLVRPPWKCAASCLLVYCYRSTEFQECSSLTSHDLAAAGQLCMLTLDGQAQGWGGTVGE
jgi:hypothetical protein